MVDKEKLKDAICNNNILFLEKNKQKYSINDRFTDENNDTLLLYSVSDPQSNVYEYFLKNGADYTLVNDEGENIIHSIVFSGDNERLKILISKLKVDINHQAIDGATPLLLAISLEKYEIAKTLIDAGANAKIGDINGITPLHLACQEGAMDLVKLLIENKVDLKAKTVAGNTPISLAANHNHDEIVKLLYSKIYI